MPMFSFGAEPNHVALVCVSTLLPEDIMRRVIAFLDEYSEDAVIFIALSVMSIIVAMQALARAAKKFGGMQFLRSWRTTLKKSS